MGHECNTIAQVRYRLDSDMKIWLDRRCCMLQLHSLLCDVVVYMTHLVKFRFGPFGTATSVFKTCAAAYVTP